MSSAADRNPDCVRFDCGAAAVRPKSTTRTARWAPTRRARGRDEWGDTTPPPHDGKGRPTLSEELEDGADPVRSAPLHEHSRGSIVLSTAALASPQPVANSAPQRRRHSLLHTSGVVAIGSKFPSATRARAARAIHTNSNNRLRSGRRTCRLELVGQIINRPVESPRLIPSQY